MWERPFGRDLLPIAAKRPLLQPLLVLPFAFHSRRSSPSTAASTGGSRAPLFEPEARFSALGEFGARPVEARSAGDRTQCGERPGVLLMYRDVRMSGPRRDARLGQTFCLLFFAQAKKSRPPAAREPHLSP